MESPAAVCPKCGAAMEVGVAVHRIDANYYPLFWLEGEPVNSVFLGFEGNNLDCTGKQMRQIGTSNCTSCGFLEFYARKVSQST